MTIERLAFGDIPKKHHIQLRGADGALRWEECFTREGFDAAYTIAYHLHRPHEQTFAELDHGWRAPHADPSPAPGRLAKRHFRSGTTEKKGGAPIDARVALLFNSDLVVSVSHLKVDPGLSVGSAVTSGGSRLGEVIDFSHDETEALARYTNDAGNHVTIEVRQAATLQGP